jgi:hypothetical protein
MYKDYHLTADVSKINGFKIQVVHIIELTPIHTLCVRRKGMPILCLLEWHI